MHDRLNPSDFDFTVPGTQLPESLRKEFEKDTISSLLDLDLYKLTMGQFA